jgi:YNFM family putative membrane transporter
VVNGIYIASYYLGGALGSWLPAEFYRLTGWQPFLLVLAVVLGVVSWSLMRLLSQISNR